MYGYAGVTISGYHIVKRKEHVFKNFKKIQKAVMGI